MMTTRLVFANKLVIFLSWVLACSLTACHSPQASLPALDQAQAQMQERPDSALTILQDIGANMLLDGALQARYALLYTQALEKNNLPIQGDSLINIAVRYYEENGNNHDKALAYLYQGVAYQHMDSIARSLFAYMRAVEKIDAQQDPYTYGLSQSYLATLYRQQGSNEHALAFFKKSAEAFAQSGHKRNMMYALGGVGDLHLILNQLDSALCYYAAANEIAVLQQDTSYMYLFCIDQANILCRQEAYAQAQALLFQAINTYKAGVIPAACYLRIGYTFLKVHQLDSARHYLQLGLQNTVPAEPEYAWGLSLTQELAKQERNWEDYLDYQQRYTSIKDTIQSALRTQDVQRIEANYYQAKSEREKTILQRRNMNMAFLIGVLVLSFPVMLFFIVKRWRKHTAKQTHKLIDAMETMEKKHAAIQQIVHDSFTAQWDASPFLEQIPSMHSCKNEEQFCDQVLSFVHAYHPGFIPWLQSRFPKLHGSDICLICLLFSDLSIKEVVYLYNLTNAQTLYTRYSRMYKKVGYTPPPIGTIPFKNYMADMYKESLCHTKD